MRQRKVRNLEEKMQAVSGYLVEEPAPDVWTRVFDRPEEPAGAPLNAVSRDLYLEIGCGRGDFLVQMAEDHPESNYIGIEGQASVVLRAMEKAAAGEIPNLRFACTFVNKMDELFRPDSLSGIYLNFSDPWPKARHAKRRLTYRGRLKDYAWALRPGGSIAVKTDNDALFDFTLEEIEACGWTPAEMSRNLHESDLPARLVTTEYEKKFRAAGKNINYVKVAF